ncbi:MAG TPA: hypothetical protein VF762_00470 [Blastocatellia bacterium]|jgi:hypothetical protein
MSFNPLAIVVALALLVGSSRALDEPEQIRVSDLGRHPFVVGNLKITIKKLHLGSILINSYIEVTAENTSNLATTFNAQQLSFVGKDGILVRLQGRLGVEPIYGKSIYQSERPVDMARPVKVAAHARVKRVYGFSGGMDLPASFFYEGKKLALIVK